MHQRTCPLANANKPDHDPAEWGPTMELALESGMLIDPATDDDLAMYIGVELHAILGRNEMNFIQCARIQVSYKGDSTPLRTVRGPASGRKRGQIRLKKSPRLRADSRISGIEWEYILEYQEGSVSKHYRAVDSPILLEQVLNAFSKYLRGDESWRSDFTWEKLDL